MTDGLRADFANNPIYTPNLHEFFKKYGGYKFINAYSTANWTFASRMSFHTGLIPSKNGLWDITYGKHAARMENYLRSEVFKATNCTDDDFLLTKMKKAGYNTKYVGDERLWKLLYGSISHLYDTNSFYDYSFMQIRVWKQEKFKEPFFVFGYDFDGGHDPWGVFVRDKGPEIKGKEFMRQFFGEHPTAFRTQYIKSHQKDFSKSRLYQLYGDQVKQYDEKLKIFFEWFVESGL